MSCCTPPGPKPGMDDAEWLALARAVQPAPEAVQRELRAELIPLKGGFFDMGARRAKFEQDFDAPRRKVHLSPFAIAPTACTNAQYARFVADTGYRTLAEVEGWSFVFHLLLDPPAAHPESPPGLPWWRLVNGACWHAPEGPGSTKDGREDHPAVHLSWYDALAYCTWAGLRLPTEAQWEFAARGGQAHAKFPWGNAMTPGGAHRMNTWQGDFPTRNTGEDGYLGTAPVRAYEPNGYGLWNCCGNVWEWAADAYVAAPVQGPFPLRDPEGPDHGIARVQRGGSYLCHVSYCDRYHVHSRTKNDADSSTGNAGFRVAG